MSMATLLCGQPPIWAAQAFDFESEVGRAA
jgi:hypothetical protein